MNTHLHSLTFQQSWKLATCLCALTCALVASPIWADEGKQKTEETDLNSLKTILELPQADLDRTMEAMKMISDMSPEEKATALARLNKDNETTADRKKVIARWNDLSPEMKKAYFNYLRNLPSKDRPKFKKLPWAEQLEAVKKTMEK